MLALAAALLLFAADTSTTLSLDLNVPAFRLVARENGAVRYVFTVASGKRAYPTPIGVFGIDYAVWNPPWTPPASPWARGEKAQPPGPDNWMGRVKLHFTGLVFLHGSPFTRSFGTAASHACVRMANDDAIRLARLVHQHASPAVTDALLDSLVANPGRTHQIGLDTIVRVTVRYDLAEVRGDTLELYPDIYPQRRASPRAHALSALAAYGIDSMSVDSTRLARLLARSRHRMVSVAARSLQRERS